MHWTLVRGAFHNRRNVLLHGLGSRSHGGSFWQVVFASSIQIFATVISPFTIAGEGVREIVQALLLAKHIGTSQSILSAALGFWAAEALTLGGAVFWWIRKRITNHVWSSCRLTRLSPRRHP